METQIETDDMPKNKLQCLHTSIVIELLNIEYIHISNFTGVDILHIIELGISEVRAPWFTLSEKFHSFGLM